MAQNHRADQERLINQMIGGLQEALEHLDHPATTMCQMLNTTASAARVTFLAGRQRGPGE